MKNVTKKKLSVGFCRSSRLPLWIFSCVEDETPFGFLVSISLRGRAMLPCPKESGFGSRCQAKGFFLVELTVPFYFASRFVE